MNFNIPFRFCPMCGSRDFVKNNIKSMRCESCGFVYYVNPSAAVAAFITNDMGDLLVCVRGKDPAIGTYDLPGGFVDYDESANDALKRELSEELRVEVIYERYLFSIPNKYLYSGMIVPTLDIFFECRLADNKAIKASDDVADCFFVPVDKLDPAQFGLESIKEAVRRFIDYNTVPQGKNLYL